MLDGRIATLALALCLALVAGSAQSQRRPQQMRIKQPETTVPQEKSHEDLRGTKQSPLIIEVAPTPKTDTERAEETKERERITELERNKEKSDSDIVRYTKELAFFTKGLFAATVALVLATIGLGSYIFDSLLPLVFCGLMVAAQGLGNTTWGGGSRNRHPTIINGMSSGAWMSDGISVIISTEKLINGPSNFVKISNNGSIILGREPSNPFGSYIDMPKLCLSAWREYVPTDIPADENAS